MPGSRKGLVRWIIELHRLLPGGWVTLQDIYRCTVDAELLARKIGEAQKIADQVSPVDAVIPDEVMIAHADALQKWDWEPGGEYRERVEAIERWYDKGWSALDAKLRTSIVEGISVFLSLFDQPDVAGVFCPPPPEDDPPAKRTDGEDEEEVPNVPTMPGLRRKLPPLADLLDSGKVLALNMPAGANPALARAIGVLLKSAWM